MTPGPWTFHAHLAVWVTLAVVLAGYLVAVGRPRWRATARQRAAVAGGLFGLAVAMTWPLGDIAVGWSLTALVLQRLVLLLAVPPLVIAGLPRPLLASVSRPWPLDRVAAAAGRPLVAVAAVTAVGIGTLLTPVVDAAARDPAVRAVVAVVLLAAGFVLWAPVLEYLPGSRRISPAGQAAYLVVQSLLPGFFSVIWIFARRPLYATYDHRFLSFSPLGDQQVAGFTAKLGTIVVLWAVAGLIVARAGRRRQPIDQPSGSLEWLDVQREFERLDRQERRGGAAGRRPTRSAWLPPLALSADEPADPGARPGPEAGPGT